MDPVGKALWFVETHFGQEIVLDDIAAVSGVSRYHLSRAFAAAFERSVMRYVRGRRLSEAAKSLANDTQNGRASCRERVLCVV